MSTVPEIRFRDEAHFAAHRGDFALPLEEVLQLARDRLASVTERTGWLHFDFRAGSVVGRSGLLRIRPWTRGDFWARRMGRAIPSHLVVGEKRPTRSLCIWGYWSGRDRFVLHTLYPGIAAPREIHDPELALGELPKSLRFWTAHAIVVSEGEWEP
ncbi:MAG TPA: hypothetical protein VMC79_15390 [Rectinemataceae bacterium]|nr:hypothetical protein [Rectinemataceae bacterium]